MEKLILDKTEDTPQVIFDIESDKFSIEGRSLPENAVAFYIPLIDWLDEFGNTLVNDIVFDFKLDYFNTASAKQITKVMLKLQALSEKKNIKVNWHYFIDDIDIKSSGARFAKLIKVNIELVSYTD